MEELKKFVTSVVLGGILAFTKQYGVLIVLVAIAICFDIVTGLIKAKSQKQFQAQSELRDFQENFFNGCVIFWFLS